MPKNSWRSSVLVTNQENTCLSCFLPLSSNRFGILWLSRLLNSSSSQRPMTARHMAAGPPFFCFKTELDLRAVAQVIFQPVCDPTFPTPQERPYSADCHFTPRWRSAGARPPRRWARWSPARTAQGAEPGGAPLCTGTAPRTAPVRPSHTPSPPSTRARPYPCIPRSGIRPLASLLPSIPSVAAAPGLGSPRCGGARRRLPSRRGRHVGQLRARRRLLRVTAGGRQGEGDENGRKGGREAALPARTHTPGRKDALCLWRRGRRSISSPPGVKPPPGPPGPQPERGRRGPSRRRTRSGGAAGGAGRAAMERPWQGSGRSPAALRRSTGGEGGDEDLSLFQSLKGLKRRLGKEEAAAGDGSPGQDVAAPWGRAPPPRRRRGDRRALPLPGRPRPRRPCRSPPRCSLPTSIYIYSPPFFFPLSDPFLEAKSDADGMGLLHFNDAVGFVSGLCCMIWILNEGEGRF